MKDLRKADTWWPGSVAERSGPSSYVVALDDGRVWKRHFDHVRRDSMNRTDTEQSREYHDKPPYVPLTVPFSMSVSNPAQVPSANPANRVRAGSG